MAKKRVKPKLKAKAKVVHVELPRVGAVVVSAPIPPKIEVVPIVHKKQKWWEVLIFGRN